MLRLPEVQDINGTHCRLIKRTEKVALLSVNDGWRYEVCRIYIMPKVIYDNYVYYQHEVVSSNGQFGRDGSKFFTREEDALKYFEKLDKSLYTKELCKFK